MSALRRIAILVAALALVLVVGCSGQTDPATNVTATSATLHGRLSCKAGVKVVWWWRWRQGTNAWQESAHFNGTCPFAPVAYSLAGLSPNSHYQFEICGQSGEGYSVLCVSADGRPSPPDHILGPVDAFDTSSRSLRQVDGGPGYYGQFSNPLPSDPSYFPLGVWLESALSQSDVNLDKDVGLNLYIALTADSDLSLVRSNGMRSIIQSSERDRFSPEPGAETAAWELYDEVDMQYGPGAGYDYLNSILAGLPQDGRARFNNYGKGVMFWETDSEAEPFVNDFQQLQTDDIYWFTDPHVSGVGEGGSFFGLNRDLTYTETRRAANYGYVIDRMRALDAMDGVRKPIWAVVEVGWPFTETAAEGARAIEPTEIRAAVWHSIIAGARGILYFNHSFGGPCPTQHALRDPCYAEERAMVKSINVQIAQLAPVLNAPFEDGFASVSGSVRMMTKNYNGQHYIFAGSRENVASNATFTVASGTTATVEGEDRTIPITGGRFTDDFADDNAIHIYRVN
jgi:hypothetical protein